MPPISFYHAPHPITAITRRPQWNFDEFLLNPTFDTLERTCDQLDRILRGVTEKSSYGSAGFFAATIHLNPYRVEIERPDLEDCIQMLAGISKAALGHYCLFDVWEAMWCLANQLNIFRGFKTNLQVAEFKFDRTATSLEISFERESTAWLPSQAIFGALAVYLGRHMHPLEFSMINKIADPKNIFLSTPLMQHGFGVRGALYMNYAAANHALSQRGPAPWTQGLLPTVLRGVVSETYQLSVRNGFVPLPPKTLWATPLGLELRNP